MSTRYAQIQHGVMSHPKFAGISPPAFALWAWAVVYSGDRRTDGNLDPAALAWLGSKTSRRWRLYASELVARRLWEPGAEPGTYRVHDYLEHNLSAAAMAERAEIARRAAAARWASEREPIKSDPKLYGP